MSKMDISIVTPSYKRAGKVRAADVFLDKLTIACHEFEADQYKKAYPSNAIMVLPDSTRGNMAKVRNYIRDHCNTRYLVMVDDDVEEIGYQEQMKRHPIGIVAIMEFLEHSFQVCEDAGTILWGVNLQADPKFYREYSPFSFLSPVLGPFSCHIVTDKVKKETRYDERLGLNEDYDYALQVLWRYHKIFRNNKYYYLAGHLTDTGGCGAYRLLDEEKKQAEIMQKKWGKDVVRYNFGRTTNPRINVPLKGI
jgi:hypothetical protein